MADSGNISLNQAPEHFFDREKWLTFLALYKTREGALHGLSFPEPRITIIGDPYSPKDLAKDKLKEEILNYFEGRLFNGDIVAKGFQPPSVTPVDIPSSLWKNLSVNFVGNSASGKGYEFLQIQLSEIKTTKNPKPDMAALCADWLRDHAKGEQSKKVLLAEAYKHFGNALKTRDFDAAYKKIFGKKRGRPRKSLPK